MDIIENQEIIKKYVDGTLSAAEHQTFEQALATDTDLQKEVETYRALHFITRNRDLMATSQTIGAVISRTNLEPDFDAYQSYLEAPSVKWWSKKGFWLLGTLVIALVVGLTFYQVQKTNKQAQNEVIVLKFLPFQNIVNFGQDTISPYARAMYLYDKGDFAAAKPLLATFVRRGSNNPTAKLYLGITQLLTNDNEAAVATLRLAEQNPEIFAEPIRFNLALALLKTGKREEATDILRGLLSHPIYAEKAEAVMDELKLKN